ncbi:MAG: hypothetical protein HZB46_01010 [Solirubrobacterales bacterium]|nr:hypothetical protein [Solirubrobacterales bacterium]
MEEATAAVNTSLAAVAERYLAAWEARDPSAIAALHAHDTRFLAHVAGQEPAEGRAAGRVARKDTYVGTRA